jgi:drug/metabolite transporter (DMT)-like permease
MTILTVVLCITCQLFLLAGQLLFKRAMAPAGGVQSGRRTATLLIVGIATQAVYFFLWLGLLAANPLTKIFPFEGLNPAMMAILAWIILKEKLPPVAWVGLILVCVGIGIVSMPDTP